MNYKEKYEKALERAKEYWETDNDNTLDIKAKGTMEYLFPELKESENEKIRKMLIDSFTRADMGGEIYGKGVTYKQVIAWLEKQGASYTKRDVDDAFVEGMAFAKNELEKQKSSWSEDDEKMKDLIISVLEVNHSKGIFKVGLRAIRTEEIVSWLKSLKEKYIWKPSGEQMVALHDMNLTGNISYAGQGQTLIELYNDLKKL